MIRTSCLGGPGVVTVGDKREVTGHQYRPLYTVSVRHGSIRLRQSLAFAFEVMHARFVVQVAGPARKESVSGFRSVIKDQDRALTETKRVVVQKVSPVGTRFATRNL